MNILLTSIKCAGDLSLSTKLSVLGTSGEISLQLGKRVKALRFQNCFRNGNRKSDTQKRQNENLVIGIALYFHKPQPIMLFYIIAPCKDSCKENISVF